VYKLNQFCLALDYIEGFDERVVSIGELGLIYAILPEVLLDMMAGNVVELEME
jgi:hypothetical protein